MISQSADHEIHKHKIVNQFASSDSTVHKMLVSQLRNIHTTTAIAGIEVVCHGPGIYFLVKTNSIVRDKIAALKNNAIVFSACNNLLREQKTVKSENIEESGFVLSSTMEVNLKQEQCWCYIKAGRSSHSIANT